MMMLSLSLLLMMTKKGQLNKKIIMTIIIIVRACTLNTTVRLNTAIVKEKRDRNMERERERGNKKRG